MSSDIVLTVDEGRRADAARFFGAGTHLLELLDDLVETAAVEWTVADLRQGSAVVALEASGDYREAGLVAIRSAVTGLRRIGSHEGLPAEWTPSALSRAKDLARIAGDHATLVARDNVVWLDQQLRVELEAITPWVREFYGSVRGELTGVNVTRGNRASIKPHGGGRVVHVGFPAHLAGAMKEGLLRFVEIEGMVRQNEDGRTYYVWAENLRAIEEPHLSWRDLRGYLPEITGQLSIEEYLEGIHGKD